MPDSTYNADLRDIRFVLFEHLDWDKLTALPAFASADRASVELLLDECHKLNRDVLAPLNQPGDRAGCRYTEDGQVLTAPGFKEAYRQFVENGWLRLGQAEDQGGMALPYTVVTAAGELNIGACCSLALSFGLTTAAADLIAAHGSDELKALYLERLYSGAWQGTMCITEPQAGSAVGDIRSLAKRDGDAWLLTGNKVFITCGDHDMTENHVHLVLARTEGAPKGVKGLSLFVVPKLRPDAQGNPGEPNDVSCAGIEHKMGIHASPTCVMQFGESDGCRAWIIGEEGQGLPLMFHMMNHARIGTGLLGTALAAQAYTYARAYAHERVQGTDVEELKNPDAPRVPIHRHPTVRRNLLWCKAVVEGCRALLYKAAYLSDLAGASPPEQAKEARALVEFLTPICKAYASDMGFDVTRLAMQVMGGYGYVAEYPIEQHMRDVKPASIYEGTNEIQALDLIGRKLAAKGGALFMVVAAHLDKFVTTHKQHAGLGKELAFFTDELARWKQTTMGLGMKGMSGDRRYPVLCAVPYLEMAGNTVVAWLLLEQAIVAHDRLTALYGKRGAADEARRAQLHEEDAEVGFYFNKIETARFFLYNVLTRNHGIAAQVASNDRSALDFVP